MLKKFSLILFLFFLSTVLHAQVRPAAVKKSRHPLVRIKDVGKVIEYRDNQLIGFGLVVGLRNSGDSRTTVFTREALTNLLKKMGITPDNKYMNAKNVASVIVTATLPPFIKKGQRIPVIVSSLGDASSLGGGTLLMTPLQGADFKTYAVAQGPVVVGGVSGKSLKGSFIKNQTTVGRVPDGAIVEAEVPVTREDQKNITIVLNEPNFITSSRAANSLVEAGFGGAKAVDATSIKVPVTEAENLSLVDVIAKIENTKLIPDSSSKVIINSRSGTVVIGEMVRLFPVAITHGSISVKIEGSIGGPETIKVISGPAKERSGVQVAESSSRMVYLEPDATLSSLVEALNEIGVSSRDLISIIQALSEAGALVADIEVI